jgi:glycosyltransferase involved in cell wall biosynthesis/peptidoglycan/xylan/chitin deacetylase (PgdA/CDA1 family)
MMRAPALVLAYHSLTPWAGDPLGVTPEAFSAQMRYLAKHGWSCISLLDLVRHMEKGTTPPRRSFVLTFDDGYLDCLSVAAPILASYGWTATVFVVTGLLGEGGRLPHDLRVAAEGCAGPERRSLTWEEAAQLAAGGFTIGSHTHTHRSLTHVGPEDRARELADSAAELRRRLGIREPLVCYPFGDADGEVIAEARSAGYRGGVVTRRAGGLPETRWTILRAGVYGHDTAARFAFKVGLASTLPRDVLRLLAGRGLYRNRAIPRAGRRRVLQMTSSSGLGGIERSLVRLVPALDRCGTSCEVLPLEAGGPAAALLEESGITVRGLQAGGPILQAHRLRALLREGGYDVVHAYGTKAAFLARVASRWLGGGGPKVVTGVLSTGRERGKAALRVDGLTRRWNDLYLSNSRAGAAALTDAAGLAPGSVPVLYDGVEPEGLRRRSRDEIRASLGIGRGAPVLICVANLRPMKGHATLLNAFARVREGLPASRLLLVGEDRMGGRVQELAAGLLPAEAVLFLGCRADVEDLLAASDLFVLASDWEGLPVSLLEAMRAGLPIVATGVSGIPEAVAHGRHGLLVRPGNPAELAAAIIDVLREPARARRMAERARERFLSEFTIDRTARELAELYAGLAQGRRGAPEPRKLRRAA